MHGCSLAVAGISGPQAPIGPAQHSVEYRPGSRILDPGSVPAPPPHPPTTHLACAVRWPHPHPHPASPYRPPTYLAVGRAHAHVRSPAPPSPPHPQVSQRFPGFLLDPIYSLAAWQAAWSAARVLAQQAREPHPMTLGCSVAAVGCPDACPCPPHLADRVVMIHNGGALGLFGLAQAHPSLF